MPVAAHAPTPTEVDAANAALAPLLPLDIATPDAVATLQRQKLRALVTFVRRHVPWYARLSLSADAELPDLPQTDKARLMYGLPDTCAAPGPTLEELRALVPADERLDVARLYRNRSYVLRTSGTTGFVGFFLWDAAMAAIAEVSATRFVPAPQDQPKPVVAVAPVVLWHPLRGVLEDLHSIHFGAGLRGTIERLHALRPRTIIGSTGFVVALAEEQLGGRLHIEPQAVVIGAEQCTSVQWERIRRAWGVEPAMQYGLSEAGLIASRCPLGNWHIHEDTVILELLDERGRPALPGQPCARALLTRLFGPTQPLLRYEIGDELVAGPSRCPCGRPFSTLAAIGGRRRALLWLRAEAGGVIGLSASALIAALELTPGLMRYQIRYERPDEIEIALLTEGAFDAAAQRDAIAETLRAHGAIPPRIRISPGAVPDRWAAPAGAKEHHVQLSVTRAAMEAALCAG